ncbi:L-serine ammonia-lyase, iron-sulfur-dependent, subunit alpha [Natranaerobius trueperi]|uniref:L-serine dehydratase n=1 Tax=Natranaerobius trueperi TaxID=759412 RepID=A0A226C079_9FIRM|nr:L-serine ammonia-lyase, iron-sulfur-dependent, subunit alpha [Natranaerobius trueperi]OWZ84595.1 L-serine ammonia-lyase, iron-sulfur-dependent, subunit alpha [Natranaerobius trueperi]
MNHKKQIAFSSLEDLVELAHEFNQPISWVIKQYQSQLFESSIESIENQMEKHIQIMEDSVEEGVNNPKRSLGGLIGGEGKKLNEYVQNQGALMGPLGGKAVARSLAVSEVNASMGKVVASPTAGACGILPGVLLTVFEQQNQLPKEKLHDAFFTASGIGIVVSMRATLAGAEGGCQAECGVGGAMAAGGAVELLGGSPEMVTNAVAIALKGVMGLVCDPVAGLVEVPCQKRNASSVSVALSSADMALSGIESTIPADEVIDVMYEVGKSIPPALRETAEGGLATSPTGEKISQQYQESMKEK